MQKSEALHNHSQNQPTQRQGRGASLESPQGEQIAQLEAMVEASPQAGKLAQLAAMADNSPRMTAQRKAISAIHNSPDVAAQRRQLDNLTGETAQREEAEEPLQAKVAQREETPAKPNNTGLSDNLKSGIESLSGMSMDNVKVHYNSSQPAQLNALAYAQGTDIHVAPGQEQHLPHEAWHVVQQAQGRVRPTMQMKDGVPVNDDAGLEREADVMGAQAQNLAAGTAQRTVGGASNAGGVSIANVPVQLAKVPPARIEEGDWAVAGAGATLNFTALAAGCLAVVAEFSGGGGAGIHLAMLMDPEGQWSQFRNAVAAKSIVAVHLYSDMIGEDQGWHVKQTGGAPATEMSPRSAWMLGGAQASQNGANDWVWDAGLVTNWFAVTLGAGVQRTVTSGAVAHQCP
jgi:hypothetical protein